MENTFLTLETVVDKKILGAFTHITQFSSKDGSLLSYHVRDRSQWSAHGCGMNSDRVMQDLDAEPLDGLISQQWPVCWTLYRWDYNCPQQRSVIQQRSVKGQSHICGKTKTLMNILLPFTSTLCRQTDKSSHHKEFNFRTNIIKTILLPTLIRLQKTTNNNN